MSVACTDMGNVVRLVNRHGSEIRYVPAWGTFLTWNGVHWERDPEDLRVTRHAVEVCNKIWDEAEYEAREGEDKKAAKLRTWAHLSQMSKQLRAMVQLTKMQVVAKPSDFDSDPWALNCTNGTIDLKTGRLRNHRRDDNHTKCTGIRFDPKAKAPRFEKFMQQILPDVESRRFLQRYAGYCATGIVTERMFAVLYGAGANGKSVFIQLIEKALGQYAAPAPPELLMAKTEGHLDIVDLCGVRLATSTEVRKDRTFDEEKVKRLTGGDTLKGRRLYENLWSFAPTHKLMLAANHKPTVRDASDSFWSRVALVPFTVQFARPNQNLLNLLMREASGILAWVVRGCLDWQTHGLEKPRVVAAATQEYRNDEDPLGRALLEIGTIDAKAFVRSSALFSALDAWRNSHNMGWPFREKDVVDRLRQMGCVAHKSTGGARGWRGFSVSWNGNV